MSRIGFACFLALLMIASLPQAALAHGVQIDYQVKSAVEVTARYDTGEPLSEGQVSVYTPDNLSTPWASGICDASGRYVFTPDPSKPGIWDVQVRKAGHGGMIHISVGENQSTSVSTAYTTPQIVLMGACVVWGLVGTALFFTRRKG